MATSPRASRSGSVGEPAADAADKRLKAERLFLGEREFILYPERD